MITCTIQCNGCGATGPTVKFNPGRSHGLLRRQAEATGWDHAGRGKDLCPACASKSQQSDERRPHVGAGGGSQ